MTVGRLASVTLIAAISLSCGHGATSGAARDVRLTSAQGGKLSEAELQEDVLRFTGQFLDRITQATDEISGQGPPDKIADEALRMQVVFFAASLDIAIEPLPEVSVLDMAVFVRLSHEALVEHWIPQVLGERGRPFIRVFERAEADLAPILSKILNEEQKRTLDTLIEDWRRENPGQYRVENVRLSDFAVESGKVASERQKAANGLLASVKGATQVGEEAMLLAQRESFALIRLPFILRGEMRLGAREMVREGLATVGSSSEPLLTNTKELAPIIAQLTKLATEGNQAAREARLLIGELRPLVPTREAADRIQRALDSANTLTSNTDALLRDVRGSTSSDRSIDATLKRGLGYLVLLGFIWTLIFWGGYVVAKRVVRTRN
jgi:hypothetical protein